MTGVQWSVEAKRRVRRSDGGACARRVCPRYTYGCGTNLLATYTVVSVTSSAAPAVPGPGPPPEAAAAEAEDAAAAVEGAVEGAAAAAAAVALPGLWWTAMGFTDGRGQLASSAVLFESDLAPMVRGERP